MKHHRGILPDWAIQIDGRMSGMQPLPSLGSERPRGRRMYGLPASVYKEADFHDVYEPCKVSLGPSYAHLDSAKEVKEDCVVHFLRRTGKPIESCYNALREVVHDLREAYDGLDGRWRNDAEGFMQMMLLDGCFLLEFIRTISDYQEMYRFGPDGGVNSKVWGIVENQDEMKMYIHDVLLLQNQLPMMVLSTLLKVADGDDGSGGMEELRKILRKIGAHTFGIKNTYVSRHEFKNSSHLLDVYRRSLAHRNFKWGKTLRRITTREETRNINNIPSATELDKVGIAFTTSNSTSLLDVRLHRKTLKLPQIIIDGLTKSTFLNFIAFEQHHKNACEKEITSYMYFMGCLIQSAEDASLLQSRGIISTALPAADVANLFKRMTKDIRPDRNDQLIPDFIHILAVVRERYNKIMSNEWQKGLSQTYLRTPWKIMSVVAASLLLVLTIIQTIFSVLSYVHPK